MMRKHVASVSIQPTIGHIFVRVTATWATCALLALFPTAGTAQSGLKSGVEQENFSDTVALTDDFYEHVNGKWLEKTEIPADRSNYGSFSGLADDAEAVLRELVEKTAEKTDHASGSDEQKVGDFYRSYMNTELLEELGSQPLEPILERIATLKSKDDLLMLMADAANTGAVRRVDK